jgi:hypothetical protein
MQELKQAWLSKEQIANFDEGIYLGSAEIQKPGLVKPTSVPIPETIYPYKIPAPEKVPYPEKVGGRLVQNGKPNVPIIKEKIGTMAGEKPGNQNDLASLVALDKIAGTDYASQVRPIYEALELGIDESGKLSSLPKSVTGRSTLGSHIGKIAGMLIGGPAGFIAGQFSGAAAGLAAGGMIGDAGQALGMYLQSPAGAVKAYKFINDVVTKEFPKTAKISAMLQKAESPSRRAALINALYKTLESESGVKIERDKQGAKP